jgi:hypothetical protein
LRVLAHGGRRREADVAIAACQKMADDPDDARLAGGWMVFRKTDGRRGKDVPAQQARLPNDASGKFANQA